MIAALVASVIGGVLAIALSLPLRSPDGVFFNTATVAGGSLVAGLAAGAAWRVLGNHVVRFEAMIGSLFVLVAAAIFAGEQAFMGLLAFALPLAAVVLGSIAALAPLLARRRLTSMWWVVSVAPLLALGVALASQGDTYVQTLSLPTAATTPVGASKAVGSPAASPASAAGPAPTLSAVSASTFPTPADVRGVVFAVGPGSQAQFTVGEKLAQLSLPSTATMTDTALSGQVRLDGSSVVNIDLQQLSSDQSRRDNFIRQQFRRPPTATVTIDNIGALPAPYVAGEVVKRQVSGRLNILGNESPITFDVEARLDGDTLSVLGRTTFRWADFKIPPPNVAGTVQVEDQVTAVVLIVAKATR